MTTNEIKSPEFSFFDGPITNKTPRSIATIEDVYRGIRSDFYKERTLFTREVINDSRRYRAAKQRLDYVTFSGTFKMREKESLIDHSGLVCIDFDKIKTTAQIREVKQLLINDPIIDTALLFTSPSGRGLKWVVEIDLSICDDHEVNYLGIVNYLKINYKKHFNNRTKYLDESGKDVSRACFLCWDPEAHINPKYL